MIEKSMKMRSEIQRVRCERNSLPRLSF